MTKGRAARLSLASCAFLLVCSVAGGNTGAFSGGREADATRGRKVARPQARLQLSTRVLDSANCGDGNLRLRLRLRYHNAGPSSVILDRDSNTIIKHMVSRSLRAAKARRYALEAQVDVGLYSPAAAAEPPARPLAEAEPPSSDFVVIRPGGYYDTEALVHIPAGPPEGLGDGRYVLQVRVSTWFRTETTDEANSARRRWRRYGLLWFEPVTSVPMPLVIRKEVQTQECQ